MLNKVNKNHSITPGTIFLYFETIGSTILTLYSQKTKSKYYDRDRSIYDRYYLRIIFNPIVLDLGDFPYKNCTFWLKVECVWVKCNFCMEGPPNRVRLCRKWLESLFLMKK